MFRVGKREWGYGGMIAKWFLFKNYLFINLAAWGLSCSMWDLLLQCLSSLVVAHRLSGLVWT